MAQSDGLVVDISYDGSNRVRTVSDANGTQTFTYNTNSTEIQFADAAGNDAQIWTYTYDATSKQLTKVESPAGTARLTTTFAYETVAADGAGHAGNVKSVTQTITGGVSRTVTYGYDARGNRTLERDALGNTITRSYDAKNQLTSETHFKSVDPDGSGAQLPDPQSALTTRYIYDDAARLRFVVSAEGRVSERRYGANGLIEREVSYTADRYSGSVFSEGALSGWAGGLADKSQIELTQYAYDFRGNLSQTTQYGRANASSGEGILEAGTRLTQYVYDNHGLLRQTIALRGGHSHIGAGS